MSVTERDGLELTLADPPTAPWVARAGAALLDAVVLLGVGWVVDLGGPAVALTPWTPHLVVGPGVAVGSLLLLVLQAYLGVTPGKAVVGIAVVGDDARPVGLARTALRAVAHVVDALPLGAGFLRPLWHPEGRTFADSLTSTQVLRTAHPRAHPALAGPDADELPGPPFVWTAPPSRRRRHLRVAAAAVCALAVVAVLVPTTFRTTTLDATVDRCTDPAGLEASLVLVEHRSAVVRPGWTRDVDAVALLEPRWSPADAPGDVRIRLRSLTRGTTYDVRQPAALSAEGLGLSADPWPAGDDWAVELLDRSGAVVAACGGTVPAEPPALRMPTD